MGHVLATQCLLQRKPKSMAIHVDGKLRPGVSAKDLILHIIGRIGVGGGTGHVIEYRGPTIEALSMDERMTVCNMSIEAGARAGLIAPDQVTFDWLQGRPRTPRGAEWERAIAAWRTLASDAGASYDNEVHIDASAIGSTISYGTHPGMVTPIAAAIPAARDAQESKALAYMQFDGGAALTGREAEAEGLDEVFRAAGAEWREAGCSMCIGMNGDIAKPGQLVVSTSNRNFEGRQGPGVRTVLASPRVAAVAAIAGVITDPDAFLERAA